MALLLVAASAVLLGTLYPLVIDALGMGKLSVGPPYFDTVFVPLMTPALFLMGVGPIARWRQASLPDLAYRLRWAFGVSVASAVVAFFALGKWTPMIGLGLALLVVWLTQGNALTLDRATFQRIALFSAVPGLLAVVVLAVGLREVRRAAPAAGQPILGSFRAMPASFRRFLLIFGLFTLGNSADAFIILRAQERGLSVIGVLAMLLAFNVVYTAVAGPAGRLSDRIGRPRLILAGWAVYAVIYLGLALAGAAWQVVVLFIAYGTYHGLVEGNARAFVADLAGAEGRGAAYGLYHAVVGLATLPASLIAGVLWQGVGGWAGFGPAAPFLFGAALAGVAALLFFLILNPLRPGEQSA